MTHHPQIPDKSQITEELQERGSKSTIRKKTQKNLRRGIMWSIFALTKMMAIVGVFGSKISIVNAQCPYPS